jgi:hypothetical protein
MFQEHRDAKTKLNNLPRTVLSATMLVTANLHAVPCFPLRLTTLRTNIHDFVYRISKQIKEGTYHNRGWRQRLGTGASSGSCWSPHLVEKEKASKNSW